MAINLGPNSLDWDLTLSSHSRELDLAGRQKLIMQTIGMKSLKEADQHISQITTNQDAERVAA